MWHSSFWSTQIIATLSSPQLNSFWLLQSLSYPWKEPKGQFWGATMKRILPNETGSGVYRHAAAAEWCCISLVEMMCTENPYHCHLKDIWLQKFPVLDYMIQQCIAMYYSTRQCIYCEGRKVLLVTICCIFHMSQFVSQMQLLWDILSHECNFFWDLLSHKCNFFWDICLTNQTWYLSPASQAALV